MHDFSWLEGHAYGDWNTRAIDRDEVARLLDYALDDAYAQGFEDGNSDKLSKPVPSAERTALLAYIGIKE